MSSEDILDFWFGPLKDEADFPTDKAEKWFRGGEAFNQLIRDQFGTVVDEAVKGSLDAWSQEPKSCLALIILLDQFTRNLGGDTAASFRGDEKALAFAQQAIDQGVDQKLWPVYRLFFYLPLEHAEDLKLQEKCVALHKQLAESVVPALEFPVRNALDYAVRHYDIIKQFGRFPHRNQALGRSSTPEEIEFLKKPESRF